MYDHIDITEESGITTITLNRPEKLNALGGHMRRDLAEALEAAADLTKPQLRQLAAQVRAATAEAWPEQDKEAEAG